MSNPSVLGFLGPLAQNVWSLWPTSVTDSCLGLTALTFQNTTILSAAHVAAGSNISTPAPGSCQSSTVISTVDVCRVYGVVNTTAHSAVKFEIWLPDTWYGRFLGVGNTGLGGCINYDDINYGASLHFATIGSDNGHDGSTGLPFLDHPEVINDFAYRAIHTEAVAGKQIVEAYYNGAPSASYYMGCSTGGRQGLQSALLYPDDFDGIVSGAPAIDFNHLLGWHGLLWKHVRAASLGSDPDYITNSLWPMLSQEVLRQCDGLDGRMDGIISEPDDCGFDPTVLLCAEGSTEKCLTQPQVSALSRIYQPVHGSDGQILYPRFDPGSEGDPWSGLSLGLFFHCTNDWMKYMIYNDSSYSFEDFGISDLEFADTINPGGIATWSGDLANFRSRGGKFLTYHGRQDALIPSGISKRLYDLVSSTLAPHPINDFYRLFLVPGLNHCAIGQGAWAFGQGTLGTATNIVNDTAHNVLLAIVDWVENGIPPPSITGTDENLNERTHCMYPEKTIWTGTEWICVPL